MLALGGDGNVTETLLVPQVLEGGHHVGLEVVPAEGELLVVRHRQGGWLEGRCGGLGGQGSTEDGLSYQGFYTQI